MFTSRMPAVKRTAQGCLANRGKQQQRAQKLTTHPQPPCSYPHAPTLFPRASSPTGGRGPAAGCISSATQRGPLPCVL